MMPIKTVREKPIDQTSSSRIKKKKGCLLIAMAIPTDKTTSVKVTEKLLLYIYKL